MSRFAHFALRLLPFEVSAKGTSNVAVKLVLPAAALMTEAPL